MMVPLYLFLQPSISISIIVRILKGPKDVKGYGSKEWMCGVESRSELREAVMDAGAGDE